MSRNHLVSSSREASLGSFPPRQRHGYGLATKGGRGSPSCKVTCFAGTFRPIVCWRRAKDRVSVFRKTTQCEWLGPIYQQTYVSWGGMYGMQMAEYRISVYGRKQSEWDQLASWIVNNELYSENVTWLIQVYSRDIFFHSHSCARSLGRFSTQKKQWQLEVYKTDVLVCPIN